MQGFAKVSPFLNYLQYRTKVHIRARAYVYYPDISNLGNTYIEISGLYQGDATINPSFTAPCFIVDPYGCASWIGRLKFSAMDVTECKGVLSTAL